MPTFLSPTLLLKKARGMASKAQPDVSALDCIFACSVCGSIPSDIYKEHDTVHGLSDGINCRERIVTRLYLASCCHVICIKHIGDGNGPPFHPAGQHPQAACPVCEKESGDSTAKQLFSVRGYGEDEYDPTIPKSWFKAPPMALDGKDKEMEALRFQYLALIRYSKNITSAIKQAKKEGIEAENKFQSIQSLVAGEREEAESCRQELERLRPLEHAMQKHRRLQERVPAITHYLKLMPKLVDQNLQMQQRLASLGFAMALEPVPVFDGPLPPELVELENEDVPMEAQNIGTSHTAGMTAQSHGYSDEREPSSDSQPRRPFKRSRVDSPARVNNIHAPSSRDLMPPPLKPLSKMKSIRKIIPTIRNKFTNGRHTPVQRTDSDSDVQMHDNSQWDNIDRPRVIATATEERPPTRHGGQPETPYMSGALPTHGSLRSDAPAQSKLLSGLGVHGNESKFTFEPHSPVKIPNQRSDALPTEPSYIRLLDGLGRHTGLDLGLEDPRRQSEEEQPVGHLPPLRIQPVQSDANAQNHHKQWNFGHAFLQQSPINANPTSAHLHSDLNQARQGNAVLSNAHDHTRANPITPAPNRFQRPADEADHVVSPFFGDSDSHSQPFSRSQFAEPQDSSSRSAIYQSRPPKPSTGADWCEPRSLNGLSFFNSPLNERNEPIEWRREGRQQEYAAPPIQHRSRNINSQGLLIRPNAYCSPVHRDNAYNSLERPYSTQIQSQPQCTVSYPSFSRPSHSRASRLPSAMPSIISGSSPVVARTGTANLGQVGVRGSQQSRPHIPGNTFARPAKPAPAYSSNGRRVVRR